MKYSGALGYDSGSGKAKLVGIALVITGTNMAKLVLQDEGKTFKNGTNEFKVALEDLPAMPRIAPNNREGTLYRFRMSGDGTEVESLSPVTGTFDAVLVDVSRESGKDSDPAPYERDNKFAEGETYKEFWVSYQIVAGHFESVTLPAYRLHYKFEEDPAHEGFTKFIGNPENSKATRLQQLIRWGLVYGIWDEPIAWTDDGNVLPEIFDRAVEQERIVSITIKDGYPIDVERKVSYDDDAPKAKRKAPVKAKASAKAPAKKPVAKAVAKKPKAKRDDF